jgi:membrane protein
VFETADRLEPGAVARLAEVVVLVWGSTRLFLELQASLNAVWGLQPRRPTARSLLRSRMLAFALVVTLSFMLVVSLAFSAAVTSLVTAFPVLDASSPAIAWLVRNGLLFVGVATAFTFMYRVIPDTVVQWRVAAGGAAVTALFFVVATELLKLITAGKGAPYGASGSFVVYLLWVYGSARAALFGAVLSQNYAARRILK